MTPEQITDALGPDWNNFDTDRWSHPLNLQVLPQEGGRAVLRDWSEEWPCPTPEAAVAVAQLLVAAERIAAGARVALAGLDLWRPGDAGGKPAVYQGDRFLFTHEEQVEGSAAGRAADAAEVTR